MSLENTWQEIRHYSSIQNLSRCFKFTSSRWCFFSSVHPTHIGLGSGDWGGHGRSFILCSVTQFFCGFNNNNTCLRMYLYSLPLFSFYRSLKKVGTASQNQPISHFSPLSLSHTAWETSPHWIWLMMTISQLTPAIPLTLRKRVSERIDLRLKTRFETILCTE